MLVTLTALVALCDWLGGAAPDSLYAQEVSVVAQAIPLVTAVDRTATRAPLTEGYLTQPFVMAHGMWSALTGVTTLNLEGLTLQRGELSTGGYGEGYVDRRHPHAYVHELLLGAQSSVGAVSGSLFAGRGFVPYGSDDPMMRPFEKYPVNHHLSQILERAVIVGAVRAGPIIGEAGTFDGDETASSGTPPNLKRFGDSWSARLTALPAVGAELSASLARVKSPEVRAGGGLDQRKVSVVARYERDAATWSRYALAEWAHTDELDQSERITSLGSVLGEAAVCRAGVMVGARLERTDRPEEEQTLDPFRAPRPSTDLSNLGVSRWTTATLALSAPRLTLDWLSGRPFVEIARIAAAAGNPPGIFNADLRYGASRMWMFSAGVRVRAAFGGMMHDRMGRYGVAVPEDGTRMRGAESEMMPGMPEMPASAARMNQSSSQCTL